MMLHQLSTIVGDQTPVNVTYNRKMIYIYNRKIAVVGNQRANVKQGPSARIFLHKIEHVQIYLHKIKL